MLPLMSNSEMYSVLQLHLCHGVQQPVPSLAPQDCPGPHRAKKWKGPRSGKGQEVERAKKWKGPN